MPDRFDRAVLGGDLGRGGPERAARAMAAVERELIRPRDRLALLFTPPSTRRRSIPATSRAIRRASARTAASTPTPPLWSVMAFAALGEGDKAASAVLAAQPHQPRPHPGRRAPLQGRALCRRRRRLCRPAHVGRGGWTWYTGSAGWMHRAGVESILGLRVEKRTLHLDPCIPKTWPRFEMTLRHGSARYEILVENPDAVGRGIAFAQLDEKAILEQPLRLPLADDGLTHHLRVRLGQSPPGVSSILPC